MNDQREACPHTRRPHLRSAFDAAGGRPALGDLLKCAAGLARHPCVALAVPPVTLELPPLTMHDIEIRDIFTGRQLLQELNTARLGGTVYAESLAMVLGIHLLRTYSTWQPRLHPAKSGVPPHALRRVLAYIDAHVDQPLGLAHLAALVSLSTPHFLRMFKHAMDK